jgi:hypothetical protein
MMLILEGIGKQESFMTMTALNAGTRVNGLLGCVMTAKQTLILMKKRMKMIDFNDFEEMDSIIRPKQTKITYLFYSVKYKIRNFFKHSWKIPHRYVYHSFQKSRRGFSDKDAWNGDQYLAGQIAGIMQWIIDHGHGCEMEYAEGMEEENHDIDVMVKLRDADYGKHIAVFKEYAKNGSAHDEKWQKEFGGVLDSEIQDSLQWLTKHFQGLWD